VSQVVNQEEIMRFSTTVARPSLLAASLGLCLMAAGPALTDGGGGGGGGAYKTTFPQGEVYDGLTMSCVY